MKQQRDTDNYPIVNLSESNRAKTHKVANLVARCWIGPVPFEGAMVLHKHDNKDDSRVSELFYGTHQDNMTSEIVNGRSAKGSRNGNASLTEDQVRDIKNMRRSGISRSEVARRVQRSSFCIYAIDIGLTWSHIE